MDCLRNLSFKKFSEKISLSDQEFLTWLRKLGLLYEQRVCVCGAKMNEVLEKDKRGNVRNRVFRCSVRKCRKKTGLLTGTFFERSRLSVKEIFYLSYCWCRDRTPTYAQIRKDMVREFGGTISPKTIVEWMQYFRDVAIRYFENNSVVLGGSGKIVEVGETVLTRGTNCTVNKTSANGRWIFGGVERGSPKCFLVMVERKDPDTLLPLIQQYVSIGSTIITDCCPAYSCISALPEGYTHRTVSHSECSASDSDNANSISNMKSLLQKFKHQQKEKCGTSKNSLKSYLSEFQFKQLFHDDLLYNFWRVVSEQYPLKDNQVRVKSEPKFDEMMPNCGSAGKEAVSGREALMGRLLPKIELIDN